MSSLIELGSAEGQLRLQSAFKKGAFIQPFLQGTFSKQIGRKMCGIQTCALLIGAAKLGRDNPGPVLRPGITYPVPISEAQMLESKQTLMITSQDAVAKGGLSLRSVADILKTHNGKVDIYFASKTNVDKFRKEAKRALESGASQVGAVVNYHMKTLGQGQFGGHHSPLAAYDETTDSFLLLDTWPETQECWAGTEDLFKAMDTQDDSTGESRGFCIVHF